MFLDDFYLFCRGNCLSENQLAERTITGLHTALVQALPDLDYETPILDIGCGTGAWLERLSNIGFTNLYGVDLDTQQFKAQKAICLQANLDSDALGFGNKKFGLITAIEVIEHLENPGRLFHHVLQHLEPDGYLLLTTPNIHSVDCRLRFLITGRLKSFDSKGDPTHIYPVLMNALERILPRYSLEVLARWGYPERGSIVSRKSTQAIAALLKLVLPNDIPGDTLCLLIRKTI